ncbi:MAG: hypothetical protein ABIE22_00700 [archaeon]
MSSIKTPGKSLVYLIYTSLKFRDEEKKQILEILAGSLIPIVQKLTEDPEVEIIDLMELRKAMLVDNPLFIKVRDYYRVLGVEPEQSEFYQFTVEEGNEKIFDDFMPRKFLGVAQDRERSVKGQLERNLKEASEAIADIGEVAKFFSYLSREVHDFLHYVKSGGEVVVRGTVEEEHKAIVEYMQAEKTHEFYKSFIVQCADAFYFEYMGLLQDFSKDVQARLGVTNEERA